MRAHRSQAGGRPSRPPSTPPRTGRRAAGSRAGLPAGASTGVLLRELVAHLREGRTQLRDEWVQRIIEARLLTAMSRDEIFAEATSVYDNYLDALETGTLEALQAYARSLSERIIPRGVETHEVVGIVLLLRDVLARSLFAKYQADFQMLNRVLDAYEPAANHIAITVAVGFVQERERVIREQQEAIGELSTPVLPVRERLLILPIIGLIDAQRARQLTEQLLRAIRANRAKVVVIDITGVPAMPPRAGCRRSPSRPRAAGSCARRPAGRDGDRHRPVARDRPDAGQARSRPEQDEYRRRPAGLRTEVPAGIVSCSCSFPFRENERSRSRHDHWRRPRFTRPRPPSFPLMRGGDLAFMCPNLGAGGSGPIG